MSSPTTSPDSDQVRQMIKSLSPDAIARLIPQETIQELLKAQGSRGQNRGLAPAANQPVSTSTRKKKVNGFMAFRCKNIKLLDILLLAANRNSSLLCRNLPRPTTKGEISSPHHPLANRPVQIEMGYDGERLLSCEGFRGCQ